MTSQHYNDNQSTNISSKSDDTVAHMTPRNTYNYMVTSRHPINACACQSDTSKNTNALEILNSRVNECPGYPCPSCGSLTTLFASCCPRHIDNHLTATNVNSEIAQGTTATPSGNNVCHVSYSDVNTVPRGVTYSDSTTATHTSDIISLANLVLSDLTEYNCSNTMSDVDDNTMRLAGVAVGDTNSDYPSRDGDVAVLENERNNMYQNSTVDISGRSNANKSPQVDTLVTMSAQDTVVQDLKSETTDALVSEVCNSPGSLHHDSYETHTNQLASDDVMTLNNDVMVLDDVTMSDDADTKCDQWARQMNDDEDVDNNDVNVPARRKTCDKSCKSRSPVSRSSDDSKENG